MQSGLKQAQIRLKNADNNSIYGYDYDNDGVITIDIGDNQNGGEYIFDYFTLYDNAYQSNQVTYRSNGLPEYQDQLSGETRTTKYNVDVDNGQGDIVWETITETEKKWITRNR